MERYQKQTVQFLSDTVEVLNNLIIVTMHLHVYIFNRDDTRFILLKNVQGFKLYESVTSTLKRLVLGGGQYSTVNVQYGELVEIYNQTDMHCNMRVCSDPTVLIFTQEGELLH